MIVIRHVTIVSTPTVVRGRTGIGVAIGINAIGIVAPQSGSRIHYDKKPKSDSDCDPDPDSETEKLHRSMALRGAQRPPEALPPRPWDSSRSDMNATLHQKALAYLAEHNVMTLATTGTRGVWASALFYVNDGFTLYFLSSPRSRHSINLANHSAIAATIQEDYRDWREIKGVQLEGVARKVQGIERAAAIARYQAALVGGAARAPVEVVSAMKRLLGLKSSLKIVLYR
jgi:uncharacterized protein YhbP (UPF0306 family)